MCEMKNTMDGITGIAKEKVHELEDLAVETNQNKAHKEKQNNKKQSIGDNCQQPNICVFRVLKGKERWGQKNI